jgi:alkylation response protein AidB-like acyl-CoA dehydrogenase
VTVHFELDDDQQAIVTAVDGILGTEAGPARARELGGAAPRYDTELSDLLGVHGYLGFAFGETAGPVEAALVVEAVARACGVVAAGTEALVVPGALPDEHLPGPVALAPAAATGPIRFAADAKTLVVVGADEVTAAALEPGSTRRIVSRFGYPMAVIADPADERSVGPGAGAAVRSWWRLALALELVGTARAALDLTVGHVRERRQFGRALGSFQALQHRLAECEVLVQGARWLAMEAAWSGAEPERTAAALTQALRAAERTFWDTHQFSGALGFAVEYDLHLWTMRLPALRAEALAMGNPAAALTAERWSHAG